MKNLIIVFILFFTALTINAQDFKPVKTAKDVIDNYITAIGGSDALKEVESISMKGRIGEGDESGTLDIYYSSKYVYMDINMKQFTMLQAIDMVKKKGWMKFGKMVKDLKEEEIMKNKKRIDGSMFGKYLDPAANNITFELLQNEDVNGTDCYVIDIIQDSLSSSTEYFDSKTFNKVKENKGGMTSTFSDFKKVGSTDVIMPYRITSQTGDVTIAEIKFNSKFNKKLLTRPKDEDTEDTKKDEK